MTDSTKQENELLAWVDLETTGLDPRSDVIYEIAVVVTDGNVYWREVGPNLVIHQEQLPTDEYVINMHTSSGLLKEVELSQLTTAEAEQQVLDWLMEFTHAEPGQIRLAGSTIAFDRSFLAEHMPKLEAWFHYRSMDVSSIHGAMYRWLPALAEHVPETKDGHRALDDILESIDRFQYYRNALVQQSVNLEQSLRREKEKALFRGGW